MAKWFNPRVLVVAISIVTLVLISKVDDPLQSIRRAIIACSCMFVLYMLAFVVPIFSTLGFRKGLVPLLALLAAWTGVALALIADAMPISLDEKLRRHVNVPMVICCIAATCAFFLFFESTTRALRQRDDLLDARLGRP